MSKRTVYGNLIMLSCIFRVPLESVLRPFYEKAEHAGEDQMQVVRVRRRHIWKDALRAFAKHDFMAGVLISVSAKRQRTWVVPEENSLGC